MSTGIYTIFCHRTEQMYVGQSRNLEKRLRYYEKGHCKNQPRLFLSITQHGWSEHTFQIVLEFPKIIKQNILNSVEEAFISKYKHQGWALMNMETGLRYARKHKFGL